jgi:gliding motility associated protien GldN
MKKIAVIIALVGIGCFAFTSNINAQTRRKKAPAKRVNTKRNTTTVTAPAPVDSVALGLKEAPASAADSIPLVKVDPSLRQNSAVSYNLIKDKMPLAYENLREEDQMYKQVVWRDINIKEKMNTAFRYEADEDNGNQRFISILLQAVQNGDVTAFSAINDRFTRPLRLKEITSQMIEPPTHLQVPDWVKDPTGATMKDSLVVNDYDPNKVQYFRIKEEIIFDRKTSRLHHRIIGLAPLKTSVDQEGNMRGDPFPLFWVYYPDLRPTLAKHEAYNPRNFGARMSWEDLFESGYFASRIVKSTLDNPNDKFISFYTKDPLMRLYEGEKVKEAIFNFEQDQWSY